jgi:hypothetical protein
MITTAAMNPEKNLRIFPTYLQISQSSSQHSRIKHSESLEIARGKMIAPFDLPNHV